MSWDTPEGRTFLDSMSLRMRQLEDHLRVLERRLDEFEMRLRGRPHNWSQMTAYEAFEPVDGAWQDIRQAFVRHDEMSSGIHFESMDDPKKEKKEEGWD